MKRVICVTIISLFCCVLLAQQRKGYISENSSLDAAERYFRDNAALLDPIEGIYDMAVTQKSRNPLGRVYSNDSVTPFFVYKTSNGVYGTSLSNHTINRVGNTNVYSLCIEWGIGLRKYRFVLEDKTHFIISYEVPTDEVRRGMGRNYRPGFQTFISFDGIKTFPTEELSRDSRKTQEGQNPPSTSAVDETWSGTGFALNNGYIVTNAHVVDKAKTVLVYGINGDMSIGYTANVKGIDRVDDLAIIKIADSRFPGFGRVPYAIKKELVDVGEDIWVLGYPLTQVLGNEIKLTNGVISSMSGFQGDSSTYQISAPVQPGNSGGPLFDSSGNIVGVVNAGVPGAENVGYAVKSYRLFNLVESNSLSSQLPLSNSISSMALKDQVKAVRDFVFLLICSSK